MSAVIGALLGFVIGIIIRFFIFAIVIIVGLTGVIVCNA